MNLSPSTQALLQAVLYPDEPHPQALQTWLAATELNRLEPGQFHLLPLIASQLQRIAPEHPWLPRIKGIYRRVWYANQRAIRAASEVLQMLEASGQAALLIGPAALALTVYAADQAQTLRAVGVPQVLVPTEDRGTAIQVLSAAGWQPCPPTSRLTEPRFARWQAGYLFAKPSANQEVDQVRLCWHALPYAPLAAWGSQWFERAVPLAHASLQAQTLDPTDQLLQALTTGPALELIPLVDGARLIARAPIDWPRLVAMATQSQLAFVLHEQLATMRALGVTDVPAPILAELALIKVPPYARALWHLDQIRPWERTAWQRMQLSYAVFQQTAAMQHLAPHPGHLYAYLRTRLATDTLRATLKRSLQRLTTRLPLPHGY
ncbi:nucleotidyltransferase family protein [Candidatus Chloroploca sp. M-50]|uniref:Nucleotidyltransferase family protein n=1 Tax=Candidatus Chloroploca mongolica TaxID=2528176 RepID=A0ABS4D436_9CHLR|nr:nucleotidyltransferase family protein [Candidatus Chloroploca mongolica]MBP1464206.1 nucleotidyltransferase family protein [Candidatus Chloroploca mongolica]